MSLRARLLGLCLAPALLCAADGALTLGGQSAAYWAGQRDATNELSPMFHALLVVHPAAFAAGIAGWMAVFVTAIVIAPPALASVFSMAVALGHAMGAITWLVNLPHGYQVANVVVLGVAAGLGLGVRHAARHEAMLFNLSRTARAVAIAGLFALGAWLFLWPH